MPTVDEIITRRRELGHSHGFSWDEEFDPLVSEIERLREIRDIEDRLFDLIKQGIGLFEIINIAWQVIDDKTIMDQLAILRSEFARMNGEIEELQAYILRLHKTHNPEVCVDVQEYAESLKAKIRPLTAIWAAAEALVFERDESYPIFETSQWLLLVQLLEAARAQEEAGE